MKNDHVKSTKQQFNKKEWREKKYSNKYKIQKWEERRQKAVMRSYFKEVAKDNPEIKKNYKEPHVQKNVKVSAYKAAQNEFKRIKEEKEKKCEEIKKKKEEIKEALHKYREAKLDKLKKISKKTKRGQPVMKDRMKMLYEKIQNIVK